MKFLKTPAYRFRVNGRNGDFLKTMMPYIVFPLFWCFRVDGRKRFEYAKEFYVNTVRLKKTHTHYCVRHGKALEFLSISLRDTVPIMHTREGLLFFSSKRLVTILSLARPPGDLESLFNSPYCFCEGKLFSEVNLWHLTAPILSVTIGT